MAVRIRLRRDTPENWLIENPVLAEAEIGIEVDPSGAHRFKIGDGVRTWTDLSYAAVEVDDPRLSDPRAPIEHAASHELGGDDEITVAATQVSGLATVATSGDFADLTGTPPLPEFPVTSVNGKVGEVQLTAADVNADPAGSAAGRVPVTRTINGKQLTGDVTLTATDVGAVRPTYDNEIGDPPGAPLDGQTWFVEGRFYLRRDGAWVEVGAEGLAAALSLKANTADLGNAATRDVGTTAGTVAAGDDARIVGAVRYPGYSAGRLVAVPGPLSDASVSRLFSWWLPVDLRATANVIGIGVLVHTPAASAGAVFRMALHTVGATGEPDALIVDGGTVAADTTATYAEVSFAAQSLGPGIVVAALQIQGATSDPTMRCVTYGSAGVQVVRPGQPTRNNYEVIAGWRGSPVAAEFPASASTASPVPLSSASTALPQMWLRLA